MSLSLRWWALWAAVLGLPLAVFALTMSVPELDKSIGSMGFHFYVVSATATDVAGNSETVSTTVTIVPAAPIGVTITYSPASVQREVVVTFTAVVTPATTQIVRYEWTFGDGSGAITTGNQTSKSYGTTGTKVVRVTVVDVTGRTGFAQIEIEGR